MLSSVSNYNGNTSPNFKKIILQGNGWNPADLAVIKRSKGLERLSENLKDRKKDLFIEKNYNNDGKPFYSLNVKKGKVHINSQGDTFYNIGLMDRHQVGFGERDADRITAKLDRQIAWDNKINDEEKKYEPGLFRGIIKFFTT